MHSFVVHHARSTTIEYYKKLLDRPVDPLKRVPPIDTLAVREDNHGRVMLRKLRAAIVAGNFVSGGAYRTGQLRGAAKSWTVQEAGVSHAGPGRVKTA